jgi:hypothetical protein
MSSAPGSDHFQAMGDIHGGYPFVILEAECNADRSIDN